MASWCLDSIYQTQIVEVCSVSCGIPHLHDRRRGVCLLFRPQAGDRHEYRRSRNYSPKKVIALKVLVCEEADVVLEPQADL